MVAQNRGGSTHEQILSPIESLYSHVPSRMAVRPLITDQEVLRLLSW